MTIPHDPFYINDDDVCKQKHADDGREVDKIPEIEKAFSDCGEMGQETERCHKVDHESAAHPRNADCTGSNPLIMKKNMPQPK